MEYKILEESIIFDAHFKIKQAKIKHDLFNSGSIEVTRLSFERGNSVAILLYESDTDSFLFTKQFRYPTITNGSGWILELTAGSLEGSECPEYRVCKEVEEEIGYQISEPELISTFFVSHGGSSEQVHLYYATVKSTDKLYKGGGMPSEKEDIQLVKIKKSELIKQFKAHEFQDAKTLIAIQWYLANKIQ
ncbi:NUDIX domain-containing protein [Bizionia sp. KMM 8389]